MEEDDLKREAEFGLVEPDSNAASPQIAKGRAEWASKGERIVFWISALLAIPQGALALYKAVIPDRAAERTAQVAEFNRLINEATALTPDLDRGSVLGGPQATAVRLRHQNTVRRAVQITERYASEYPAEFTSASLVALGLNLDRMNEKPLAIKYFRLSRVAFGGLADKQEALRQEALTLSSIDPMKNLDKVRAIYDEAINNAKDMSDDQRNADYMETIEARLISEALAGQCAVVGKMVRKHNFLQPNNISYRQIWSRPAYFQARNQCLAERYPPAEKAKSTANTALNIDDIARFDTVGPLP